MNLIEKLGLEKCKEIVDGAPAIANFYIPSKAGYTRMGSVLLDGAISLNDLRAAIDHHYYGQSEQKELEQYAVLSQEKIEGGAVLVGDNSKVVQMVRGITDTCTDIKNHISPNTKVIDKMRTIEMGDPKEVEMLLKNGGFLEMNLAELQREHAELIAFNTVLDRKQKVAEKIAEKYKFKVSMIADLLRDCSDQDMTIKAITTVVERVGE